MKGRLDTSDILLIIAVAIVTLFIILPCIIGCIAAIICATSVFEVCFLVFIIIGLAGIDGGLWWLIFI